MVLRGAETYLDYAERRVRWRHSSVLSCLALLLVMGWILAAYWDGQLARWNWRDWLQHSFYSVLLLMVLGAQPLLNKRFNQAVNLLQKELHLRPRRLVAFMVKGTRLQTAWEWVPPLAGAAAGLSLRQPWLDPPTAANIFETITAALSAGAVAWLFATSLLRTRLLATLRRGPVQLRPIDPTVRWSLEVGAVFTGIAAASWLVLLAHPHQLEMILYGLVLLVLMVVLVLGGVLSRLISSVYQSRILYALILILATAAVGTAGYQLLEGWDFMDGLYMTVISMTTVGYGETRPLTPTGRVFTMLLIVASIGIAGYAISTVAGYVVEGEFNRLFRGRRMKKEISKLQDHIILCGSGRVGREIATEFYKTLTPFVIVEPNEEVLQDVPFLEEVPHLVADVTRDQTLLDAGIEKAAGLVAALHDDQSNLFLVLSARALNPRLRIIARLADDANEPKLRRAGATAVVHPEAIGGLRMASMMIRPDVVTFLDQMLRVTGKTLRVEEVRVSKTMSGKTMDELDLARATGLLILALQSSSGGYEFNPSGETLLQEGDVLIVMGTPQQLVKARRL